MMRRTILYSGLILGAVLAFAQKKNSLDSLNRLLVSKELADSSKWVILNQLSFYNSNLAEGHGYAIQALELAISMGNPHLEARSYEELAETERRIGNIKEAIAYTIKALTLYEQKNDTLSQRTLYAQLASHLVVDQQYQLANQYFHRARRFYETASFNNNYAFTLLNLGESHRLDGILDSAIYWFNKSLALRSNMKQGFERSIVTAYATGNLGMTYNALNELDTASILLHEAIGLTKELGDLYSTSVYLADLGVVGQKEGNLAQAEIYMKEAYEMALGEGLKEQMRDISKLLVTLYTERKAYEAALTYQLIFQQYQDSLVNRENVQKVEQLKANYEIDKRESEIDLLTQINDQQRSLAIGLGMGLVILLAFAFFIYRTNLQLQQSNLKVSKREEEKALLLRELNHRVKNNLQMITSLLTLQESQLKGHPAEAAIAAGKYRVKALSLIHRKLYQEDHHTEIELYDYLEELVKNLLHGFGMKWQAKLAIDPSIKVHIDTAVPLALIVNELVTNALKYAYEEVGEPELHLQLQRIDGYFLLQVSDNGTGIKKEGHQQGFGSRLISSLVQQIEGKLDLLPVAGTCWKLVFPEHSPNVST